MSYKMIVLDLDDTLLKNDGTISGKTKKTLKKVQEDGIKVVLASGSPTFAIEPVANALELEKYGGYIISYNGARIIELSLIHISLDEADKVKIEEMAERIRIKEKYERLAKRSSYVGY